MDRLHNIFAKSLVATMLLVSCATSSDNTVQSTVEYIQQNPSQKPDFISDSLFGDECVEINQNAVWESGDTSRSLLDHLTKTIQLTIDQDIVLDAKRSIKEIHMSGAHIFNENGEIIGSTVGPITVCAATENLARGEHLATVQFTSTSGKDYTYSWVFKVE